MDNKQALGYMLLACKEAGLNHETTKRLYKEMYYQFDVKTESEAETLGFRWYQDLNNKQGKQKLKTEVYK